MKKIAERIFLELRQLKFSIMTGMILIVLSYSLSLITKGKLTVEDGFLEYATAFAFLLISIIFVIIYFRTRHYINLVFVIVFFLGFGEEISWGQRIFDFRTPESISMINKQKEFNIHNSEFLSAANREGIPRKGILRYMNLNAIFILFCISYGILVPLFFILFNDNKYASYVTGLQVPPLSLGLFFLINYLIAKIIHTIIPFQVLNPLRIDECFECNSAMIFLLIVLVFLKSTNIKKRLLN